MKVKMKQLPPLSYLFVILLVFPFSYSDPPKVALNPERLKLLEDALSWLTLRVDGKLLTPDQSNEFTTTLHEEYNNSLYFRTIAIAFQLGVLPKLTLQQGQPCDPAYTLRYRSALNNSVTWYKVKNFTLESYYDLKKPGSPSGPYCDYRQGLVCLPTTKKCDCPEGSKMEPIEPNSQTQRCLIEEDGICQLVDLKTFKEYNKVVHKLPELIFNLEKLQSCKHGTTCRVKDSPFPRCLSTTKAPFDDKNGPAAKYGEECVLDYFGEGGGCDVKLGGGSHTSYVCFNFWRYLPNKRLPSSGVHKHMGLCALDMSPYVTPGGRWGQTTGAPTIHFNYPFITAFINPRTVRMSPSELLDYDNKLHDVTDEYNWDVKPSPPWEKGRITRIQRDVGKPCLVSATEKLIDIWNFFAGLEKDPPQGQDFVADVPTLEAKLTEYKTLIDDHTDYEPRICRIYWESREPALTCVSTGNPPDANGNDGTCQISNNNDTYALSVRAFSYYDDDWRSKEEIQKKDKYHDKVILQDNPEVVCDPTQGRNRRSYKFADDYTHIHGVVLEGGLCTEGFACLEDFSQNHEIYKNPKDKDCAFVQDYQPRYTCLDVLSKSDKLVRGSCEEYILNQTVMSAVQKAPRIGMGASCNWRMEEDLRLFYAKFDYQKHNTNRYRILLGLETSGICDQTKLLNCTKENICACKDHFAPRKSADNNYESEYCYSAYGWCSKTVSGDDHFVIPLTAAEKAEMDNHYGTGSSIDDKSCENGNVCVFINACRSRCTTVNTGSTGVDVDVIGGCLPTTTTTTTTTTDKPPAPTGTNRPSRRPLEPPRPFNGAGLSVKKQSHLGMGIMSSIMIIILNSFTPVCKPQF